jgi:magnesium chelatase family protein
MIARRIPGLLPALKRDEQIAVTCVYSALGLADGLVAERPFRAPHRTISAAALAGGGSSPRPGEAQLAAHGILFLDEIVEFARGTIEALAFALDRMPAAARPHVVVSANPCPCGYRTSTLRTCSCTEEALSRYTARLEWALGKLGVAIRVSIQPTSAADLRALPAGESTASIARRIAAASSGAPQ